MSTTSHRFGWYSFNAQSFIIPKMAADAVLGGRQCSLALFWQSRASNTG